QKDPAVHSFMSGVGASGSSPTSNTGRVFIRLKPRDERDLSADDVIKRLRPQLAAIPGINTFLQNPPVIRIGGQTTKSLYQYTIQGPDIKELYKHSAALEKGMRELPGFEDVTSDLQITNPEILVDIDRNRAEALGLTVEEIEKNLYNAYGSRQISTIYTSTNQYRVIMEVEPSYQISPAALSTLSIRSGNGRTIPLDSIVSISPRVGPLMVNHTGQFPSVTISFNLKEGVALGDAVPRIENLVQSLHLPAVVTTSFQGTAKEFQESVKGMWVFLVLAILVIYIVLGILYESFIHPVTILSGLPSAGVGALLTLLIFHIDLNIYAFMGIIMLIGIVKKNAIMMIDFALDAQRNQGKTPSEAIYEGCILRFRPIMMTTMAALMGTLPIALGFGAGAEARRPLGLVVVGGLFFSQLITLFITPVIYIYMDKLQGRLKKSLIKINARDSETHNNYRRMSGGEEIKHEY
ncbi:MAG: efflux RND transporter permease subunit, partial [Pseudomonadota bacterium]